MTRAPLSIDEGAAVLNRPCFFAPSIRNPQSAIFLSLELCTLSFYDECGRRAPLKAVHGS
jgi:hypothetical protein